jgi:hypothetical protein
VDLKADPRLLDLADRAARQVGTDLSSYIRQALVRQLRLDGYEIPPPETADEPAPNHAKRPRGRPRKEG